MTPMRTIFRANSTSQSILVPVEHLNILVSVLVELADAAVDVLWDYVLAGMKDGHFVKIDH